MARIKILHYLRHLGLGGTEKTCQLFFEHADRRDFEVAVAYEKSGLHLRMHEFEKACIVSGGHLFEVDSHSGQAPNGLSLQAKIEEFNPDILHVYRSGYEEFPEPGRDIDVPHTIETNVFGFIDKNPRIDKTLFMSKWLLDRTLHGFTHPRYDFVNNPVEERYTDGVFPIANEWRSEGATIVGRCGRPDNGIYHAINVKAVRLLRLQGYDIRFLVVAPPSNMVADLQEAEIPYFVIEPTTHPLILSLFYNSIDIYTHARADGETFGVNIAEAMMHGKPVITHWAEPSVPGMGVFQAQTQLVDNDQNGFVVQNDPAAYAEALKRLVEDKALRRNMAVAASGKAFREFHVDECMKKLERIYREVVQN